MRALAATHPAPRQAAIPASPPALDPESFRTLAELAREACGITLTDAKRTMLETRLRRRLAAHGLTSFADYARLVSDPAGRAVEFQHFTDCVVTNQTSFFRETPHFDYLTRDVLAGLAAEGEERSLRIWSAASSSGQEAYSLAMVADEASDGARAFPWSVLATDISVRMLRMVRGGCYAAEDAATVPERLRRRYLEPVAEENGARLRVAEELRRRVRIGQINLMHHRYRPGARMDVVFCRNVLIYFEPAAQVAVVAKLCDHLRPGGLMVLGHSESLRGASLPLRPVHHNIHVRL